MNIIGEIKLWAGEFEPPGWTFCDGKLLVIGEFADLYSIIGTSFDSDLRPAPRGYFYIPKITSSVSVANGPNMAYIICYDGYIELNSRIQNYRAVALDSRNPPISKKNVTFVDKKTPIKFKNREDTA